MVHAEETTDHHLIWVIREDEGVEEVEAHECEKTHGEMKHVRMHGEVFLEVHDEMNSGGVNYVQRSATMCGMNYGWVYEEEVEGEVEENDA